MKVCTYINDGRERLGIIVGPEVVDAPAQFPDMKSFIAAGTQALKAAEANLSKAARRPLSSVKLAPPVRPATMLCSGSNYRDHNKEKANTPISGKEPEFFVKTADCVVGHEDRIIYDDKLTRKLDAETELAVVIGKPGRHIPVERALEHVFGYTIVNDVTARDRQVRRNDQGFTWYELGRSKCFETSGPTGPWIVTADEIGDPQTLRLRTRINGELRQSSSTANMIFSCAHLIHFFSANMTLQPGTIIITGTPGGTAWSTDAELGGKWVGGDGTEELVPAKRYLLPGDVIECELEKIGVLRNTVATA
jgi:2-keto-4-pentenoate hydratase/2-oxohepta-3-ene-1,7-dioic acid hydratase in catechol pathway